MALARSWMFIPGDNRKRLNKIGELAADIFIIDLEDAVAPAEKAAARAMAVETAAAFAEAQIYFRINSMESEWFEADAVAAAECGVRGIIVPKVDSPRAVLEAERLIGEAEARAQVSEPLQIVPLIESAAAVYRAYDIACASRRIPCLTFGSVDFTLDVNARLTNDGMELLYARSHLVVASRAAGIGAPIDAVYLQLNDDEGLRRDASFARQLGFQGKQVVHPNQIDTVNECFSPSEEDVEEARAIVEAFEAAMLAGVAAIQWKGKMVDLPVAERAHNILRASDLMKR